MFSIYHWFPPIAGPSQASSPACTELESLVMDWLGKMIGLPSEFLHARSDSLGGGVIQVWVWFCVCSSPLRHLCTWVHVFHTSVIGLHLSADGRQIDCLDSFFFSPVCKSFHFVFGITQTTASESTFVALLAGRTEAIRRYKIQYPDLEDAEINSRLVGYCSDQVI